MSFYKAFSQSSSKNLENKCVNQQSSAQFSEHLQPPNIEHELDVAKSIIQQRSFATGDNLFDHLADIIKLVIKEHPDNIVDYFEELSYNIRQQKFKVPENFPWAYFEPIDVKRAYNFMKLMSIPYQLNENEYDVCKENFQPYAKTFSKVAQKPTDHIGKVQRKLFLNENIQRLHLYWDLCGFSLSHDDVFKLSYSLQKIQFHQTIQHARFWGIIYGLKKSYFIVEAQLIQSEIDIRFEKMREEVMEKIRHFQDSRDKDINRKEANGSLIPGAQWQHYPQEELVKMKHKYGDVPNSMSHAIFDIPPEPIGTGLNRRIYFTVNSLDDEWIELPVVDPQQIQISRKIKKFFKGELDAVIECYPTFPGIEKHYLRAMIARITAGTYIAPNNYFRRLTKKETVEFYGENVKEDDEIDESDGEEEEEELDNDAIIIENENYKPCPRKLTDLNFWLHARPNILEQGRVNYFHEKKALEALDNRSHYVSRKEDEIEDYIDEECEEMFEVDDSTTHQSGPLLFTTCNQDMNEENVDGWSIRHSSTHNKINQLTILRSNLWPGAYSFTFEKFSDSIYFGWGHKYVARNVSIAKLPQIQDDCASECLDEVCDPTFEMEQAWRFFHEKKQAAEIFEEETKEDEEEESC